MGKQKEIVLIDYLIATFAGQVVFDESGDSQPWRWQLTELNASALQYNSFLGQVEALLNILNDMLLNEHSSAISREA
jgi:hypothetical protein